MMSPKSLPLMLLVALCALGSGITAEPHSRVRVGIVGAGIGGASASFYLNKYIGAENLSITVFDQRDYIGGRLKSVVVDGVRDEIGGDAWADVNEYMMELSAAVENHSALHSMASRATDSPLPFSLWNGKSFIPLNPATADLFKLMGSVTAFKNAVRTNYKQRSAPFQTLEQFLSYGGLQQYANVTTRALMQQQGFKQEFLDAAVEPVTRVIYDQNLTLNGFAGFVSAVPFTSQAYTGKDGNMALVAKLLEHAGATVKLNTRVAKISLQKDHSYVVHSEAVGAPNARSDADEFDFVVIAAPIEFVNIEFESLTLPSMIHRQYVKWFVTMVAADGLSRTYFNTVPVPTTIFTPENSTAPFNSISLRGYTSKGLPYFKIFSNQDVQPFINDMFENPYEVHVQEWPYTFPVLRPIPADATYQPFALGPNLYYINTIESAAACMEASAIAARNVAQMINARLSESLRVTASVM